MAARLTSASSQFYSLASVAISAYPFTIVGWFKPATFTTRQTLVSIGASASSNKLSINYDGTGTPKALRANVSGSSSDSWNNSTGVTNATWHHFALRITSATVRELLLDAAGKVAGSATSIAYPAGLNRSRIGQQADSGGGSFYDGAIEHVGIYNIAVSDAMLTQLATPGCDCRDVEPSSLAVLWELQTATDVADYCGAKALTQNATPTTDTGGAQIALTFRSYLFLPVSSSPIAGQSDGTATQTGAITGAGAVAANVAGTGTQTGAVTGAGALAGTSAAVSTATATALGAGSLAGTSAGAGGATATGDAGGSIAGTSAGTGAQTAVIRGAGALAGQGAAVGDASFVASGASADAVTTATGTLTGVGNLAGNDDFVPGLVGSTGGTGGAQATLAGAGRVIGDAAAQAAQTATLTSGAGLAGTSAATTTAVAVLEGSAAGTADGLAGQSGSLTGDGALGGGTVPGVGTATGALHSTGGMAASSSAATTTARGRLIDAAAPVVPVNVPARLRLVDAPSHRVRLSDAPAFRLRLRVANPMAYDIGDAIVVSTSPSAFISRATGLPTDPTTLTITLDEPDGTETITIELSPSTLTSTSSPIARISAGLYEYTFVATQSIRHVVRVRGTGDAVAAEDLVIIVAAAKVATA